MLHRTNHLAHEYCSPTPWARTCSGHVPSPLIVDSNIVAAGGSGGKASSPTTIAPGRAHGPRSTTVRLASPSGHDRCVRQLLGVSVSRMMGLATNDGTVLWEYPWATFNDITAGDSRL